MSLSEMEDKVKAAEETIEQLTKRKNSLIHTLLVKEMIIATETAKQLDAAPGSNPGATLLAIGRAEGLTKAIEIVQEYLIEGD